MKIFVVIPCYNEQKNLARTCASLGFSGRNCNSNSNYEVSLVLVDNASTDRTAEVMTQIRDSALPRKVIIIREPIRGYVPARHSGVIKVMELVRQQSLLPDAILILQADADTIYLPGYIDAMQAAFSGRRGELMEGAAVTGRRFIAKFRQFDMLCRNIDRSMEPWFAEEREQIIVDDKVCGYSLSDYWDWGGHTQEVDSLGREIHAETTRLFMRAKRTGSANRIKVDDAYAVPSRRKLWTQSLAYFASAGFPRSVEWSSSWGSYSKLSNEFLNEPSSCPVLEKAIRSRQRHLIALFALLPAMIHSGTIKSPYLTTLASSLCKTTGDLPGQMLGTLLSLADDEDGVLDIFLRQNFSQFGSFKWWNSKV